jgi:hypothetical protein
MMSGSAAVICFGMTPILPHYISSQCSLVLLTSHLDSMLTIRMLDLYLHRPWRHSLKVVRSAWGGLHFLKALSALFFAISSAMPPNPISPNIGKPAFTRLAKAEKSYIRPLWSRKSNSFFTHKKLQQTFLVCGLGPTLELHQGIENDFQIYSQWRDHICRSIITTVNVPLRTLAWPQFLADNSSYRIF